MNICDCIFEDCVNKNNCKRGLKLFQGEPIDFRFICNEENNYERIIPIETTIVENKENEAK
jgi:hypothetical protein